MSMWVGNGWEGRMGHVQAIIKIAVVDDGAR